MPAMNSSEEIIWGRYALNRQKINRSQLQKCIEKQGRLKAKGINKSLPHLMVKYGFVDEDSAKQIMNLEGMFPGYTIQKILGGGGLGVVYLAHSQKLDKAVAIKLLNPEYTDNTIILNRFLREIAITKKLDHPNIVKGLESGRQDDIYYLVLEYIDGLNLTDYILKRKVMKEKHVLNVALGTTNALYYAWKRGLTHRDIKPENIMLTKSRHVKVCDFGLAKLADANVAITMTGTIVGTPYYISPEQVQASANLDYRSDVYSLGATLYYIATGKLLFDDKNLVTLCHSHVNKKPLPPSKYVEISKPLEELILRMLEKDPAKRCDSPKDFVRYLNSIVEKIKNKGSLVLPSLEERTTVRLRKAILVINTSLVQEELTEQLERKNFVVYSTADREEALEIYKRGGVDLIVFSSSLFELADSQLLQEVKSQNVQNRSSLVVLEEKEDLHVRMQAMILGIKHFLSQPISSDKVEKMVDYVENHLSKRNSSKVTPKLKGDLAIMPLPELLQTLHTSGKTGIVDVQSYQEGVVYISNAKIIHSQLGDLSPRGAVWEMLSWRKGTFVFRELFEMNQEPTLDIDIMEMTSQALAVIDHLHALESSFSSPENFVIMRLLVFEGLVDAEKMLHLHEEFFSQNPGESFVEFLLEKKIVSAKALEKLRAFSKSKPKRILGTQRMKRKPPQKDHHKSTSVTTSRGRSKTSIEDSIIQHLAVALNIMDMSQFSECVTSQVEYQLKGEYKPLADIIVEQGYVPEEYVQNLRFFRDEEGNSLIPNYEIVKVIGEGGVAIVYLGRNVHTHETVALKIFAPSTSDSSATIARFMREAEAAKKLDHPNIVKAIDFGTIHGIYYFVMEYVSGLSLSQIITKMGRLEEQRALSILEQLTEALTYVWNQNIIHRDIKPGNILSDGDVLKICDLGLAKTLEAEIDLTQEGSILGTPQFMSPEQFRPETPLDFRTDVYSLGVTFYVMLTGSPPFTSTTKIGLAQAHLLKTPPALEKFSVSVSKPTRLLLQKMLSKDRENRCQEKDEILADIWNVQQGKYPKNTQSKKTVLMAGVAAVFLLLFGLSFLLLPSKSEEKPKKKVKKEIKKDVIQTKILSITPEMGEKTSKPEIVLKGEILAKEVGYVLINERRAKLSKKSKTIWQFEIEQSLKRGKNTIEIIIMDEKEERKYKHILWREEIEFIDKLRIVPGEGAQVYSQVIKLEGSIFSKDLSYILVNEKRAKLRETFSGSYRFLAPLELKMGKNVLQIVFVNKNGEKQYKTHILWREKKKAAKILKISPVSDARVKSEKIFLKGIVDVPNLKHLIINGKKVFFQKQAENRFHFTTKLSLNLGRNNIKLEFQAEDQNTICHHVIWREFVDKIAPKIFLKNPLVSRGERKTFTKTDVDIQGYIVENGKLKSLTINKKPIAVLFSGEKIVFQAKIKLKNGLQKIRIEAVDEKGNRSHYIFQAFLRPVGWFGEVMPFHMMKGKKRGEYIWKKDYSIMVYVPEGYFWYENDRKFTKVYLSAYYIDKYEATWEQYLDYCQKTGESTPRKPSWMQSGKHPVVNVNYENVNRYADWIGKELSTTAQWMKAARGGLYIPNWESTDPVIALKSNMFPRRRYPWGNELPNAYVNGEKIYRCNYCANDSFTAQGDDGYMYPARGGEFYKWRSPYACEDMVGNVFELCRDYYKEDYLPFGKDPKGPEKSRYRVRMGGSFYSLARHCVLGNIGRLSSRRNDSQTGFRLVVEVKR